MRRIPRPLFRAPGGKYRDAPWIVSHFPTHDFYVEPYCFAASVFFAKVKGKSEILNDINDKVMNVFRILQNPKKAKRLQRLLELTPLSYSEYVRTYELAPVKDDVEMARRLIFQSFATIGTDGIVRPRSGFRGLKNNESGITAAQEWSRFPEAIPLFEKRLKGVVLECRPALKVIEIYDTPKTFFYIDPPYPLDTRSRGRTYYEHEMTWEDHEELAARLHKIEGMAIVSSYDTPQYRALYPGWQMRWHGTRAQGNSKRVETLWMSPNIQVQSTYL